MIKPHTESPGFWKLTKILFSGFLLFATIGIANAQDFVWAPDFPVGSAIPTIEAQDQDGILQSFDDLKGDKGLLLMLSRSFDW